MPTILSKVVTMAKLQNTVRNPVLTIMDTTANSTANNIQDIIRGMAIM